MTDEERVRDIGYELMGVEEDIKAGQADEVCINTLGRIRDMIMSALTDIRREEREQAITDHAMVCRKKHDDTWDKKDWKDGDSQYAEGCDDCATDIEALRDRSE